MRMNLHKKVGKIVKQFCETKNFSFHADSECGGESEIEAFFGPSYSAQKVSANMDIVIIRGRQIIGIIEVETSNRQTYRMYSKFFTAYLADQCKIQDKVFKFSKNLRFLHIYDSYGINQSRTMIWKNNFENIKAYVRSNRGHKPWKYWSIIPDHAEENNEAIIQSIRKQVYKYFR